MCNIETVMEDLINRIAQIKKIFVMKIKVYGFKHQIYVDRDGSIR